MQYNKVKKKDGFFGIDPLPTEEELKNYYTNTYYQIAKGSYSKKYCNEEITYFLNRALVSEYIFNKYSKKSDKFLLDIGCGEGFFLKYFLEKKWAVKGVDFSSSGIEAQNPELMLTCEFGDIYEFLKNLTPAYLSNNYDVINLQNVLEHVLYPEKLLNLIKKIMQKHTILRIVVPNDFSLFQDALLQNGLIDSAKWFCPPDHLNYFNFKSLKNFLISNHFEILETISDFPIEVYLANETSNYWSDSSKGKGAHKSRIFIDNFLLNQGIKNYLYYMSGAARCSFGRNITVFVRLIKYELENL